MKNTFLNTFLVLLQLFYVHLALSPTPVQAEKLTSVSAKSWKNQAKNSPLRGWEYIVQLLKQGGVSEEELKTVFASKDIPTWTPIIYKVHPRESKRKYRKHNTSRARKGAIKCFNDHKRIFLDAEKKHKVPREILASIVQVETQCGAFTGKERVLYWLARLVSTGFPPNIEHVYEYTNERPKPSRKELIERAAWLEKEFYPHLRYLFVTAKNLGISPLEIRGSYGGAIGIPQFLPLNVRRYGIDGNGDSKVDIRTMEDAVPSVAYFLKEHGWESKTSFKEQSKVILNYNNSDHYATSVLKMARGIRKFLR